MKGLVKNFKGFAVKGNPFQMAFAIMVGTSFGLIVNSIAKDICMPIVGYATSGIDVKDLKYILQEAYVGEAGQQVTEISVQYGKTIQYSITFVIIAITTFLTISAFNRIVRKGEDPDDDSVETPKNIELLQKQVKLLEKIEEKLLSQ
jgi:large conductance mechanosensitive channel|tara:strand:+ start:3378 stop:3818 length:441 start_codon:yes stop_codon:yes gene_type:complete